MLGKDFSSPHLMLKHWKTPEDLQKQVIEIVVKELGLASDRDEPGFSRKLGASEKESGRLSFYPSAAQQIESWQVLSPVKSVDVGVPLLNRKLHDSFRAELMRFSRERRFFPKPAGAESIVYGDKVINVRNQRRKDYPDSGEGYVANGEIGIVTGGVAKNQGNYTKRPRYLNVVFSSQPDVSYSYSSRDFTEDGDVVLELAYALTVHKAQGSQFGLVILVLPNPCRLLSREMLYTAFTRQKQRLVILHQGAFSDLKKYGSEAYSEVARRVTNLFQPPKMVPVKVPGEKKERFLEDGLIHRSANGEAMRSKSEVIIADRLQALRVDYDYELPLTLDHVTRYPDFTINDQESGRVFYWEHCGMVGNNEYDERWERKQKWYRDGGVLPVEEGGGPNGALIVTKETPGISSPDVESLIRKFILC
jgi:hypothetical protein